MGGVPAWDDVHGGELPADKVREARKKEVDLMKFMGLCEEVPVQDCWNRTGRGPVSVRWVETNKGGTAK